MKFSIRDLLLVTVIVALAVGWAVDHWRQAASIKQLDEYSTKIITELAVENVLLREELESLKKSLPQPKPLTPAEIVEVFKDSTRLPKGHLLAPLPSTPLPTSQAPAPNPLKP